MKVVVSVWYLVFGKYKYAGISVGVKDKGVGISGGDCCACQRQARNGKERSSGQ